MLDKADLPGRSGLETECIDLPSECRGLKRRNGPIAPECFNFERVAICNEGCSWPLTEALINTTPSGRGSLFCSFRIAFGYGCDCPRYVTSILPGGRASGNQ